MNRLQILIIEDAEADFLLLSRHIRHSGLAVELHWVKTFEELGAALNRRAWDLILSDYKIPGFNFEENLADLKQRFPETPVILISGSIGEETAVDLLKSGLADFVLKDRLFRLIPAIERCLAEQSERKQRQKAEQIQLFNHQLLELVQRHTALDELLPAFVRAIKTFTGCDATGIRVVDERGNIPYQAHDGFSRNFLALESPLSLKEDRCMCIYVLRGETTDKHSFFTPFGSFYLNEVSKFLAILPSEEKKKLRCVCNLEGYESIALVPFKSGSEILGLIHVADTREHQVPPELVTILEGAMRHLGYVFERARAVSRLRESEALMRAIIDHSGRVIWVKDLQGRIQVANAHMHKAFQKTREELSGATIFDLLPADIAASIAEKECQIIASGSPAELEETIEIDGQKLITHTVKFPLKDEHGKVYALGAICTDITQMKETEQQLIAHEQQFRRISTEYRTLLDSVPDGIIYLSPDLEIRWLNESARKLIKPGSVHGALKGFFCYQGFWDRSEACPNCPVHQAVMNGQNEMGHFSPPETGQLFEIRAIPVFDQAGKLEGVLEILRDITAQRKLEEQFRQAQKMESIGTLTGGIAHDFNNILSAILGYGEMALEDMAENDPARRSVQAVLEAGMRASYLTKDLLLFSRKQSSQKEPVEVNLIIARLEKFLRRVIGEDIRCTTSLTEQKTPVLADGHQLEQVLMNFATNARDAMPEGGQLTISTGCAAFSGEEAARYSLPKPGDYVVIRVADTGLGMDQATMDKIFEPFFTTKDMGKGTGLGLAVVYGIIKDHDGGIAISSQPGTGTAFTVFLPMISSEAASAGKDARDDKPEGGRETILFAEDEEVVRELYATALRNKGYTVIEAADGEEAVRLHAGQAAAIDLVISDLVMPKMHGKKALEIMREIHPRIKGIFISGYAPENMQHKDLTDLHTEVLYKPVAVAELLKTVRKILDSAK